ncbi:hypothetical protein [Saccharopolyspora endophytica]|uniref:Tetratricopeptide repeat protein n=1 Tax=Saccharopolyspora endophytica TaxID=543886 RepID=A0ABS5DA95_9PSEU|nr:hypothetical protein [Saccharopolyspora endophytica]MBQ0923092.1 hypothetical protein [Saccharopolyspora endophytica]
MTDALTDRAIRDRCSALRKLRIGECLLDLERFNEAEDMLVSAAGKLDALRDEEGQARVLTVLADARLTAGDAATAFDELERALAVMRRSGSRRYIADVLRQVGRAARDLGRRDTAKLYWTEAHELLTALNARSEAHAVAEALAVL